MRALVSPHGGGTIIGTLNPHVGGLGSVDVPGARTALGVVTSDRIGQPNGILGLDEDGRIASSLIPNDGVTLISVIGPTLLIVGTTAQYTISNYDMFTTYDVAAISGSLTRVKDIITYTAPNNIMPGGFTVNGKAFAPTIRAAGPATPSVTSPVNNASGVATNYTLTSSAFAAVSEVSNHQASDWQIATDPGFTNVVKSAVDDTVNKVSWPVTALATNGSFYARVRHKSTAGSVSEWSKTSVFTTSASFVVNLTVLTDSFNFNMKAAAINAGWNQITPLSMTVTVNSGIKIGSTTASSVSFDTDQGFPVGSNLNLINNGSILGIGGEGGIGTDGYRDQTEASTGTVIIYPTTRGFKGGTSLQAQVPLNVTNNGVIAGGGGGGSGNYVRYELNEYGFKQGEKGAGGQGYQGGKGLGGAYDGTHLAPGTTPANYGNGGALGLPGGGNMPGAAGNAVVGNSFITWVATGTRQGPII